MPLPVAPWVHESHLLQSRASAHSGPAQWHPMHSDRAMSLTLTTRWNFDAEGFVDMDDFVLDPERHAVYEAFALDIVRTTMPELFDFLNAADAQVIADTQFFSFAMPSAPSDWINVPAMVLRLNFLPWAEPHETMH